MVLNKENGELGNRKFRDVIDYMNEGDVLVLNDSKVFNARLYGTKERQRQRLKYFY